VMIPPIGGGSGHGYETVDIRLSVSSLFSLEYTRAPVSPRPSA